MAKIFLLNADTVIFMIRGLKPATRQQTVRDRAARIVSRCQAAQAGGDVVGLSAITVSELEFGARHSDRYGEEIAAVQKILQPFELFDYNAVECAARYGEVRLTLERAGVPIGAMDLLTAAHALALSATLVTNNLAHFRRVRTLKVISWK